MAKWLFFIAGWLLASGPVSVLAGSFTVVEFNTWGVPLAVKDTFRYAFAMERLEELDPDFIVLSEVFTARAKRAFHSAKYPLLGGRTPGISKARFIRDQDPFQTSHPPDLKNRILPLQRG